MVGVTKDQFVNKPGRPIIPESERLEMVKSMKGVSAAMLVDDSLDALRKWKPQVFVKGSDYIEKGLLDEEIKLCQEANIQIKFTDPHPRTTTSIVDKCKSS